MTDPTPPPLSNTSLEGASVAGLLARRSRADRQQLVDELVAVLAGVVPGVQVRRSLLRRRVTALHVPIGEFVYALELGPGDSVMASRRREVRGVVIRTTPLELGPFLDELGAALEEELQRTEAGRAALARWITSA